MTDSDNLLHYVADIVSSHVANNIVATDEMAGLIQSTYAALSGLGAPEAAPAAEKPVGAVTVRKSLANPDHIISMIDGKPYTMLKRHLAQNGLTPDEYRARYDLPSDYPMTAKSYSERRRELAHAIGLGRKKAPAVAAKPERKPRAAKLSGTEALAKVRADGDAA